MYSQWEAVRSGEDPGGGDEGAPADVTSPKSEADLPGPLPRPGPRAPHHSPAYGGPARHWEKLGGRGGGGGKSVRDPGLWEPWHPTPPKIRSLPPSICPNPGTQDPPPTHPPKSPFFSVGHQDPHPKQKYGNPSVRLSPSSPPRMSGWQRAPGGGERRHVCIRGEARVCHMCRVPPKFTWFIRYHRPPVTCGEKETMMSKPYWDWGGGWMTWGHPKISGDVTPPPKHTHTHSGAMAKPEKPALRNVSCGDRRCDIPPPPPVSPRVPSHPPITPMCPPTTILS